MPARGSGSALVPLAESPRMTGRRITWAPRVKMSLRIRWRVSGAVTVLLWCADGADVIDILPRLKAGDSWRTAHAALSRGSRALGGVPTACPAAILVAAFRSALSVNPQLVHMNSAWL